MRLIDRIRGHAPLLAKINQLESQVYIQAASNQQTRDLHKSLLGTERNGGAPNSNLAALITEYRKEARALDLGDDLATGILDVMVSGIVGAGVVPEPMAVTKGGELHEDLNNDLTMLWEAWAQKPEVTRSLDERSAQQLAVRTWLRDGEVFVHHVFGRGRDMRYLPGDVRYAYELVEGDRVPLHQSSIRRRASDDTGDDDVLGLRVNRWGRVTGYHVYKSAVQSSQEIVESDTRVIAAANMTHAKLIKRVGQLRGLSVLVPVVRRIADVQRTDEFERRAAEIAATMSAYVKKGEGADYEPDHDNSDLRTLELNSGTIFDDLLPGEDVGIIKSDRPNPSLIPFRASQLKSVAVGVGAQYSSIARDYGGSYSSQRQEMVEGAVFYRQRWNYWIRVIETAKWRRFVDAAQMEGLITIPGDVDEASVYDPGFTPPALPWIDPMKEAKAWREVISLGVDSRRNIIRQRGRRPDDVDREIERDGGIYMAPEPEDDVDEGDEDEENE